MLHQKGTIKIAKPINPLSQTQVTKAKPLEKEYSLDDGHDLYLRIKPNGAKLWIFNYINPVTKKRKNISLGAEGIDPKTHRDNQLITAQIAQSSTLKSIAEEWFEVDQNIKIRTTSSVHFIAPFIFYAQTKKMNAAKHYSTTLPPSINVCFTRPASESSTGNSIEYGTVQAVLATNTTALLGFSLETCPIYSWLSRLLIKPTV